MKWHERPENAAKVERLRKMFKNTPNDVIMEKLDISFSTLHRTARALGLTKTKQFMRKCLRSGQSRGCGCARPAPLSGKTEKTVAQSDPVGDDWMFGKMGSKGLFATRR